MASVPAPATVPTLPTAPVPPRIVRPTGVPLATVGLIVGGLLLAGGLAIAVLWKGPPPIQAVARSTPDGQDVLDLTCDPKSCADGTTASIDGAKATFSAGQADLTLRTPLRVGDNDLTLSIDRPGMGRDEAIRLPVRVAYLVRADVSTMTAQRPSFTFHVQAAPGTDVHIDGKPVALDANGKGVFAVDESAATEGPADQSRVVSVDAPYVVVPKGDPPQSGTVSARVSVAPLRVDAPLANTVVEDASVLVAGRAAKGAAVTVDGASAVIHGDGSFEATVPLDAPGDKTIEVRAGMSPLLMPRTVHVVVSRVPSLAGAADDFEKKQPLDYDGIMHDVAAAVGQRVVIDGTVVDSRTAGRRTVLLMDDTHGCGKAPCITRVIVAGSAPGAGDKLRAYGTLARTVTSAGQTVPEVEAQFVLRPPP